jgi:hypothetical protein
MHHSRASQILRPLDFDELSRVAASSERHITYVSLAKTLTPIFTS